jgi:hypothetical protein
VNHWLELLLAASLLGFTGCNVDFSSRTDAGNEGGVIAEGTLYSVTYEREDGKHTTITRSSAPPANGTWNVDAYGKLNSRALVLTYPGRRELGPHVIPFDRIVDVQFGDGGIKNPGLGSTADHGEHAHSGHHDH